MNCIIIDDFDVLNKKLNFDLTDFLNVKSLDELADLVENTEKEGDSAFIDYEEDDACFSMQFTNVKVKNYRNKNEHYGFYLKLRNNVYYVSVFEDL